MNSYQELVATVSMPPGEARRRRFVNEAGEATWLHRLQGLHRVAVRVGRPFEHGAKRLRLVGAAHEHEDLARVIEDR